MPIQTIGKVVRREDGVFRTSYLRVLLRECWSRVGVRE